jgi:hypothetical protein
MFKTKQSINTPKYLLSKPWFEPYIDEKAVNDLTVGFDPFKDSFQLNK